MSTLLSHRFREKMSKEKDIRMKKETSADVMYPTGFLSFDFMNGRVVHVKTETKDFRYNSIGIVDGSMVMVIGRSGCGKTTFIRQSAAEIVKPFETSCIYDDNIEGGITDSRNRKLMQMSTDEIKDRYIPRNEGITAENFFKRIKSVHDLKLENYSDYEYDTGLFSEDGQPIYKLEPTVYILDSLALLMPEQYADESELSGQMSATATARANASIFKRIIPMLKAANIILFVVNHITEDVNINPFARNQSQLAYLKQGERLGGGRVPLYVSNLIIRFDDHSKLKETEGFCIKGIMVNITFCKSRTTASGNIVTLVFDYDNGFDRELSLFYMLKELGYINGAGAYLYIGDRSDIKFAQKNFKEKLNENPELQQVFLEECYKALMTLINDDTKEEETGKFNVVEAMMNMMKAA